MITNVKLRHTTDVYAVPVTINLMIYNNAKISEALRWHPLTIHITIEKFVVSKMFSFLCSPRQKSERK